MYGLALYLSIVFGILLFPFLIPIRSKNATHRILKRILTITFILSLLAAIAPETARIGAPFHKYGPSKIAFFGCNYQIQLTTARFCELNSTFEWCYCNNFDAFATIAHCYQEGHPDQVRSLLEMCQQYNRAITRDTLVNAYAYYDSHAKSIQDIPNFQPNTIVDFPVKLNTTETYLFKDAYDNFLGNFDLSIDYGAYLVLYWVVVFTLASVGNWSKIHFHGVNRKLTDPFSNWFRKLISLPATGRKRKTNERRFAFVLDLLVPTRAETLILTTFLGLSLYLLNKNIGYIEGDPLFPSKKLAYLRHYAVRASILSSSMMPLLILFGGRNNFLQWVTRWDYSTFITLHRWISRLVVVFIIIHSFNYGEYMRIRGAEVQPYIYYGVAGTYAGIVILIQGLLVLRRKWYEAFLLIHIVFAAIFIFGAWIHVEQLYCVWFYYVSAMIWAFDRIIRVCRLWSFGFPEAKVYLLADDTLKIRVPKPLDWEAVPGGHAFIHFLRPSCFWQSHPFTYTATDDEIVLFIKVKKGVTQSMSNYLQTHKDKYTKIRVAIEGSYGESTPADKYSTAVFVAGGNGIPGIYAEAMDLMKRDSKHRVKLVWVVREFASLFWFYEELLQLRGKDVDTTIYVTRPNIPIKADDFYRRVKSLETDGLLDNNELTPLTKVPKRGLETGDNSYSLTPSDEEIEFDSKIKQELAHISFVESRPDINEIVVTSIEESMGSVCFVTCGHPAMVDDLRASVVCHINNPDRKRIDYFEQLQVWA
ncbi:FAD-binding domain family protein [Candida parapsilosis]|uniref:FAD-binding FR-type domain-containing protein n=2 Tax=Candida parapsilosis TaxID=5480 RepID=G8BDM2_CANPC|nr:uncharacterized protein CPAR2_210140 [Candida parapsilosis]KAF6054482.1 FAD-binding domain family protein [Candida parapsilosis]KAF6056494.1 FAD-binding domain family protein [Candida parapsilosis]KAF6059428.1 FAD-binding domain family protein [Candida parapsilosis]KAF6068182.1 FAD-binding domain family protein [Candida parapsilosis]KAI5906044.1 ferric reductase transmembrane component [Candida parapsilosis]